MSPEAIVSPVLRGCKTSRHIIPGTEEYDGHGGDWGSIYPSGEVVYFVQAGEAGAIKIGFASNLRGRFNALQSSNHEQLTLLGWIDGGRDLEAFYHERYARARIRGEWFTAYPLILDEIALVATRLRTAGEGAGRG